jgi:hypothetical protein
MLLQKLGTCDQREACLPRTASPGDRHQSLTISGERAYHRRQFTIAADQRRPAGGQVRRPHRFRPRRRKSSPTPTIDHRAEQLYRRWEVFQAMNANRLGDQLIADQLPRRRRQQQLPTMRCRRDPRSAMNLQPHIARLRPLRLPDMQTHPHPQLSDITQPLVSPQRTLRPNRCPRCRHRIGERRKECITFSSRDKPTLGHDRPTNQLMMLSQHRSPTAP